MTDEQPVSWSNLTPEQWREVEKRDHTALFSREEVAKALSLLTDSEEAATILEDLYAEGSAGAPVFFFGDLLTALSLGSPSAAERVREILSESEAEAEARIASFRSERMPPNS